MTPADLSKPTPSQNLPRFNTRILPVIVVTRAEQAVPLAHALLAGGIDAMEITLRHEAGLAAIEQVASRVPDMVVGAGTLTHPSDFVRVKNCGAQFALSPGLTPELAGAARQCGMPYVPGVMTPSEVMQASDWGFGLLKLFPAGQAGGLGMLKAMAGPLGHVRFCPTGGVSASNLLEYLKQDNVEMVGGSWLTPSDSIEDNRWTDITRLAKEATDLALSLQT